MVSQSAMSLRPLAVLDSLSLRFGDFPIAMMNRRVWPLDNPEVAKRRDSASSPQWSDPRSFPDSLTCSEGVFHFE